VQEILIFHGDVEARRDIATMLEKEQFTALQADNADTGLRQARARNSPLVLVDLPYPGISGIDLCMQLRSSQAQRPIIVLTEGDEIDRILLLEAGADDCMIKPFSMRELLARIRALIRRATSVPEKAICFGDVEIDPVKRIVTRRGKPVAVSPCEYKLLLFFLQNAERPLTREALLNFVWGYDQYPNTRTVDTHVMKLRSKFEPEPSTPRHFVTIHGIGYRFLM
jgi:DNA-binding response OmpR family regulator